MTTKSLEQRECGRKKGDMTGKGNIKCQRRRKETEDKKYQKGMKGIKAGRSSERLLFFIIMFFFLTV